MARRTFLESHSADERVAIAQNIASEMMAALAAVNGTARCDEFQLAKTLVDASNGKGFMSELSADWKSRVWGAEVRVSVSFRQDENANYGVRATTQISWSSTGRTVAQATHTVALYQRAIEFAAFCEAVING